jgi:membrane protease YdiL (CAAX protease family)
MIIVSLMASVLFLLTAEILEGGLTFNLNDLSETTLLLVTMLPFPVTLLVLWIGQTLIHRRPMRLLVNPFGKIRWRYLLLSAVLWLGLCGLSDLVLSVLQPGNYVWNFNLNRFLPYLALSLILIPLQTATEEFIFRGYLAQGLSLLNAGVWPSLIIPALVFGALHGVNPEVSAYGLLSTLPFYIAFGLLAGWLTLRSRGLELSIGMHAANNLYAALMVTFPASALPSPALFSIQDYNADLGLVVFAACMLLYLGILAPLLRRMPPMAAKGAHSGVVDPEQSPGQSV